MTKLTSVTLNHFLNGLGSHESFGANEFGGGAYLLKKLNGELVTPVLRYK